MGSRAQNIILSGSFPEPYKSKLPAVHCRSFIFSEFQNGWFMSNFRLRNISGSAAKSFMSGGCSGFKRESLYFKYVYPAPICATSSKVAESLSDDANKRKNIVPRIRRAKTFMRFFIVWNILYIWAILLKKLLGLSLR